jgi:tetratricopeptide (TPR) repeat protein
MSGDDDLLERATRALRAAPPPSDEELRIERAVLMRAHQLAAQKSHTQRRRVVRWVLPLAAVLTAGTALAATGQIERAVDVISTLFVAEPAAEPAPKARKKHAAKREVPETLEPAPSAPDAPDAEEAVVAEPVPAPTAAPEPSRDAVSARPAPKRRAVQPVAPEPHAPTAAEQAAPEAETAAPSAPEAVPNGDLMRYREAHRLHFKARDFWSALHAWDSYLRTYPDGTFAIEARYNRAICLVRLGRKDEARRALAPFAAGEVGRGYRKTEAAELLEALE